jgi:ABC-type Fe3+-siderophore transport system permease subunit
MSDPRQRDVGTTLLASAVAGALYWLLSSWRGQTWSESWPLVLLAVVVMFAVARMVRSR